MAAVLRAVIEDAADAATRKSAMAYVDSTDRCWPFSFENLCEALDMDASSVRRRLGLEGWAQLLQGFAAASAKPRVPGP